MTAPQHKGSAAQRASPRPGARRSGSWRSEVWYRQPVVWLGIAVFAASVTGCLWLIAVSGDDDAGMAVKHRVFGVPALPPAPASTR